jgi:putative heme-binding domain-containing protein
MISHPHRASAASQVWQQAKNSSTTFSMVQNQFNWNTFWSFALPEAVAHGRRPVITGLILLVSFAVGSSLADAQSPRWIWPSETRVENSTATFRRTFVATLPVQSATLTGVADFCRIQLKINGQLVTSAEPYSAPFQIDVSRHIAEGENHLEFEATSTSGPATVALRLDLGARQAANQFVVSDSSWSCAWQLANHTASPSPVHDLGAVTEFELDPRSQLSISAVDDYEQWRQALSSGQGTDPASFVVTPGFEIDLVRSATSDEGSWVSMAFDPRGRIVIAREDRGLLRMTLADDGRSVSKVETVNETLDECRGLLFAHDSLYANANNSKGLYRIRDRMGNDRLDDVVLLRQFDGGVGHGRNDLALGPDGMIYSINGDSVELPKECDDFTSPFREHHRGKKSSEGFVIRTDADGKRWELVAAGLRNPFGIAFNPDGELFTYDADAEFDMGSPWYRPTQVKHLVAGADFGWRGVTGRWPPYYPDHPDNAQPSVHIGKGSPTSVLFGTRSHFPAPYRDALFILDWAYGRIIAVHLTPRGAGYCGKPVNFLKGRPLNVTDLDFAPDGSMYFVTGGRKTQAGVYRVRYVGPEVKPTALTKQQQARAAHAVEARQRRQQLESLFTNKVVAETAIARAWSSLGDDDPTIRYAARMVLERHPVDAWRKLIAGESNVAAKLNALLALARADQGDSSQILEQLHQISLPDLTTSRKVAALYCYRLCLTSPDSVSDSLRRETERQLDAIYPDPSPEVNQYLSLLLVDLKSPQVLAKTIPLLVEAADQAEQMHYLFVLRTIQSGWTATDRETYLQALNRASQYQGGEGMPGFLRRIRDDFAATLNSEEKEKFAALLNANMQNMQSEELLPARPIVKEWSIAELPDAVLKDKGDWENGKRMFTAAACGRCHRVGSVGQLVGPDLTGVGRRFSRRDILQSIIEPSAVVAENYQNDRVETSDGRVFVGRLIESSDYRATKLKVATDPLRPDQATEVVKKDIVSHEKVPTSPMPSGLLNTLTKDEIRDLLTFVESGGDGRR